MALLGVFRDNHPRLSLTLPGKQGDFEVEFIIDTGFDGDLALPVRLANLLDVAPSGDAVFLLASGIYRECLYFEPTLEWNGEPRTIEVLAIEGNPLLGTRFLQDALLHLEFMEGVRWKSNWISPQPMRRKARPSSDLHQSLATVNALIRPRRAASLQSPPTATQASTAPKNPAPARRH